MKKISVIALLLVLCTCLTVFSGCAKKEADSAPDGMKLASGENADYCMYVPDTWKVDRSDLYTIAFFSSGDTTSISTTAYAIGTDIATLEDWWGIFEGRMDKELFSEHSDVTVSDAVLGGVEGKEYSFTAKRGEQDYNVVITAVIKDFNVYYVTYMSVPKYNEDHLEERAQIIEAFKFKS